MNELGMCCTAKALGVRPGDTEASKYPSSVHVTFGEINNGSLYWSR